MLVEHITFVSLEENRCEIQGKKEPENPNFGGSGQKSKN